MLHRWRPKTDSQGSIAPVHKQRTTGSALCALAAGLLAAQPAFAQDPQALPRLEDLIPDSAVENPEDWAASQEGVEDSTPEQEPDTGEDAAAFDLVTGQVPDAQTPLEPIPEIAVDWPEDLDLPDIDIPDTSDDIRFAEPEITTSPIDSNRFVERVNDELVLAFPSDPDAFTVRDDFIDRFEALSTIKELNGDGDNIALLAARARADEELIVDMLRVYGYYDSQVIRSVAAPEERGDAASETGQVRFDIVPGVRYRFGAINLGDLESAPDAATLRAAFAIQSGDPLSSDAIVEEKEDLDIALGEQGYPFAEIGESQLLIDHRRSEGDLTLPMSHNGKYRFGDVVSSLPDFLSGSHLAKIARFEAGDVFQRSLEADLRRAILATGLVSSISITPREVVAPANGDAGVVALDVDMTKAPLRTITGAIGYGSEEGIRVQASWEHRNLFPPEGALKVRGILGTREQLAGVTFTKNNFGGRDRIFSLDAYATTFDSDAVDARTVALVGSYERTSTLLYQKKLGWAVGAEILATDERNRIVSGIARPRRTFFIGSLSGRVTYDTSDSLLNPMEGFRLTAYAAPEISRTAGQEFFYVRLQGDASIYQKVTDNVVLAGRARVASIRGGELFGVAPSRRLYAGGGGSVRGYGFQAIGPANDLGEPTGGKSLVELSAEARIKTGFFDGALSVVPFFDLGSVSIKENPDFRFVKYGAGVGIRYETGFGPIRVDVGVPLNPGPQDSPVAVYVSLGQAF